MHCTANVCKPGTWLPVLNSSNPSFQNTYEGLTQSVTVSYLPVLRQRGKAFVEFPAEAQKTPLFIITDRNDPYIMTRNKTP
ncbi:hypothetical protein KUCAC02_031044 [Chaenocephalus aceratus]|uniref:Uncharacterized protein n=1 Tax=Chaenocephalus aceratus TaxID=36190 RepID=A0ACB9XLC6_CHAAC|nr:hypothetical protein KUCAC02_031044 [Chaenocephalus aceratus]